MPKKYKVFISHAGTDTWVARKIEADIANLGADTFLDEADIEIGEDFEERILEEICAPHPLVAGTSLYLD